MYAASRVSWCFPDKALALAKEGSRFAEGISERSQ